MQLRSTTKFDAVAPFVAIPHNGRTRVRFSVNARTIARRFEGGTASLDDRLYALATLAPIMPLPNWRDEYDELCPRSERRVDHASFHAGFERRALELVSRAPAGDGRSDSLAKAHEIRFAQIRLSRGSHARTQDVFLRTDRGALTARARPLLDVVARATKRTERSSPRRVWSR